MPQQGEEIFCGGNLYTMKEEFGRVNVSKLGRFGKMQVGSVRSRSAAIKLIRAEAGFYDIDILPPRHELSPTVKVG